MNCSIIFLASSICYNCNFLFSSFSLFIFSRSCCLCFSSSSSFFFLLAARRSSICCFWRFLSCSNEWSSSLHLSLNSDMIKSDSSSSLSFLAFSSSIALSISSLSLILSLSSYSSIFCLLLASLSSMSFICFNLS